MCYNDRHGRSKVLTIVITLLSIDLLRVVSVVSAEQCTSGPCGDLGNKHGSSFIQKSGCFSILLLVEEKVQISFQLFLQFYGQLCLLIFLQNFDLHFFQKFYIQHYLQLHLLLPPTLYICD